MRITFVLPYAGIAGGIRVIAMYAQQMKRDGHDVTIASTPSHRGYLKHRILTFLKEGTWPRHPKIGRSHLDNIDVPHIILNRPRPIRGSDLPDGDVVIATWWETADAVARLPHSKGAKVYFLQDVGVIPQQLNKVMSVWSLPLHLVTISPWLHSLVKLWHPSKDVSLIPNAPDSKTFYAPARDKQRQPVVGFRYHPMPSKGSDITIEAIHLARKHIPNLQVIAYGEGPPTSDLPLPAGTIFKCQPTDQELRQIYSNCDAWLVTSRIEGFGLPILEAMTCRTPVIGTPAGAAPQLINNQNGILTQPEDPEDIAEAIKAICSLKNEAWREMSDAAYATTTSYTLKDAIYLWHKAFNIAIRMTNQ
ncbi:MAG: glycosyltransferase family 4 protein [bacterium]